MTERDACRRADGGRDLRAARRAARQAPAAHRLRRRRVPGHGADNDDDRCGAGRASRPRAGCGHGRDRRARRPRRASAQHRQAVLREPAVRRRPAHPGHGLARRGRRGVARGVQGSRRSRRPRVRLGRGGLEPPRRALRHGLRVGGRGEGPAAAAEPAHGALRRGEGAQPLPRPHRARAGSRDGPRTGRGQRIASRDLRRPRLPRGRDPDAAGAARRGIRSSRSSRTRTPSTPSCICGSRPSCSSSARSSAASSGSSRSTATSATRAPTRRTAPSSRCSRHTRPTATIGRSPTSPRSSCRTPRSRSPVRWW